MFNKWLTGLLEGDGSIIIPTNLQGNKKKYPFIRIAFHKKDLPLAQYLINSLGYGTIYISSSSNIVLWTVYKKHSLIDFIQRLNGNMRTPKHLKLQELIKFLNLDINML